MVRTSALAGCTYRTVALDAGLGPAAGLAGPPRRRRGPNNFAKFVAIPAFVECGITVRIATTAESIADAEQHQMSMIARARSGHPLTDRREACPR